MIPTHFRRAAAGLAAVILLCPGAAYGQETLEAAVARDLSSWCPGFVMALLHQGELQFFEAFGTKASEPDSALTTGDVFPSPAFTEILVGVTVEALHDAGVVNAESPIRDYMPALDSVVGSATLRQLLTHTAGLDDAARLVGESWDRTLARVDDAALVATPGTVFSESRHSIPLAIRVLEQAVGASFPQIAATAIFGPLGMEISGFDLHFAKTAGLVQGVERTNDPASPSRLVPPADTVQGVPVAFTTAQEFTTFLAQWMEGGIRGTAPADVAVAEHPALGDTRRFGGGVWVDSWRGRPRVSRIATALGTTAGFIMLPEDHTVLLIWAVGQWPANTARFVLDRVGEALGVAVESTDRGAGGGPSPDRPPPDPTRWAGTYRNGDLIFELRASGGGLVLFDGTRELDLRWSSQHSVTAHLPDGRPAVRLELRADEDGGRYLWFENRAYRHEDDPIGK